MNKQIIFILLLLINWQSTASPIAICKTPLSGYEVSFNETDNNNCIYRQSDSQKSDITWHSIVSNKVESIIVSTFDQNDESNLNVNSVNMFDIDLFQRKKPIGLLTSEPESYGVEERVQLSREGNNIQVTCLEGNYPAGFYIPFSSSTFVAGIDYNLIVTGENGGISSIGIVPTGEDLSVNKAITFANINPNPNLLYSTIFNLNSKQAIHDGYQLVFSCGKNASKSLLTDISLFPKIKTPIVASWVWSLEQWQYKPENLIRWAKQKGLNRIYIQIEIDSNGVKHQPQIEQLLNQSSQQDIEIHLVEGDPLMVYDEGLKHALNRISAIKTFCNAKKSPCFKGIQYDIEPYILDEFSYQPEKMWKAWLHSIKTLSHAWGNKVDAAVPFWLISSNERNVLPMSKQFIDHYIVMAYRTNRSSINDISQPWLEWADTNHSAIILALENGTLPDEKQDYYSKSDENIGAIERISFPDVDIVLLNNHTIGSKNSLNTFYHYKFTKIIKATEISFMGDETRLYQHAVWLLNDMLKYDSLSGIALHELNTKDNL